MWNEIRTLHFEGQNAILLALKVLSNKIEQGVNQPRSIQVFCYSKHYNRTLRNLVSVLVNRCISIQLGDSRPTKHSRLRVAGKTGNSSLKKKGSVCNLLMVEKKVRSILRLNFNRKLILIIYYWTKNKQEVSFQLMQLLAKSKIGQEVLIIGENRCGVRSAEKTA